MQDVKVQLEDRPGTVAEMGEALGRAGLSIEGGAGYVAGGKGVGHFLFEDGRVAERTLEAAGITVLAVREVVAVRLKQSEPGQLGKLSRKMAEAGVNIEVLYSDHEQQLILVVDDLEKGRAVAQEWTRSGVPAARAERRERCERETQEASV